VADELTPLEVAVGAVLGFEPSRSERNGPVRSLWETLEDACLPALRDPPARVAFSGGRDSSLVLAAAVTAARRHGLEPPVAVTLRFPAVPAATESKWQELVAGHLSLADWVRVDVGDELDCLGPIATELVRRDGARFPPNAHLVVPIARVGDGGSLITGLGGDELLGVWRWRARADMLSGRERLRLRAMRGLALGTMPRPLRRAVVHRREGWAPPWLTRAGKEQYVARARHEVDHPSRYDRYVDWVLGSRHLNVAVRRVAEVARAEGVSACAPLLAPAFTGALRAHGARHGFGDRSTAMAVIAGDRLPSALLERARKARFDDVFAGPRTREFAQRWNGEGIDSQLVDLDALRATWKAGELGVFRSMIAIQAAWRAEQPVR
jgi:asparagine synthetase B (glutamine-hydrolysing)